MTSLAKALVVIGMVLSMVSWGAAATLTSLTLEMSTQQGAWTNQPGGIWSTNTGDPLAQLGVRHNGVFVNHPGSGQELGEISIDLSPGTNTFELFGTSSHGGSDYYGLALYLDGHSSPADMAVYNSNNVSTLYSVTTAGTQIAGSANGGQLPDTAPGESSYQFSDGSIVEVEKFTVCYKDGNDNIVSWNDIDPDQFPDTYAILSLKYTPVPIPSVLMLLGTGMIGLIGLRKISRSR